MKRIAITGSHGVGKTTLCHCIMQHYKPQKKVEANLFLARNLISHGYPLNKEATSESYIQYIIAQLSAEQSHIGCDIFISDRTLLDPLAYETVNAIYEQSSVPRSIRDLLLHVWLMEKEQYDLFVFVPIEFPMPFDNVRPKDELYRLRVEQEILYYLNKYNIRYLYVGGSISQRCKCVFDAIDKI